MAEFAGDYAEKLRELAQGAALVARIREAVNLLNAIESFRDGYMTASDMLGTDGLND